MIVTFPKINLEILKLLPIVLSFFVGLGAHASTYCLDTPTAVTKKTAAQKLDPFLKASERIDWVGDCFSLELSSGRDVLFQKLIGEVAKFTVQGESVVTKAACELELIEEKTASREQSKLAVGKNNSAFIRSGQSEGSFTSRLLLSSGRPGRLEFDSHSLEVICIPLAQGAEAQVEVWLVGERGLSQISTTLTLKKRL